MAQKVTLTDSTTGEIIYPQTLVDSVQNEDGEVLSRLTLMKDNIIAFTPTGDYNPATKKYVDDVIGEQILIATSPSQPITQKSGDYWYHLTGVANI